MQHLTVLEENISYIFDMTDILDWKDSVNTCNVSTYCGSLSISKVHEFVIYVCIYRPFSFMSLCRKLKLNSKNELDPSIRKDVCGNSFG